MKLFRIYLQDGANKHKHLISTNRVDATCEMPMHNSVGTSTHSKFSSNNRHSRTHSFSAPRWCGHATCDNKEFNSMPNPHNSRVDGRQQPQTSHLDYTHTITNRTSRLQTTTDDFTPAPWPTPAILTT